MKDRQRAYALILGFVLFFVVVLPQQADAKRHITIEGLDSIPPMEFYDGDGNPAGFSVELISNVMERLG